MVTASIHLYILLPLQSKCMPAVTWFSCLSVGYRPGGHQLCSFAVHFLSVPIPFVVFNHFSFVLPWHTDHVLYTMMLLLTVCCNGSWCPRDYLYMVIIRMQEYLKDFQMVFVNMLTDDGTYVCMYVKVDCQ